LRHAEGTVASEESDTFVNTFAKSSILRFLYLWVSNALLSSFLKLLQFDHLVTLLHLLENVLR